MFYYFNDNMNFLFLFTKQNIFWSTSMNKIDFLSVITFNVYKCLLLKFRRTGWNGPAVQDYSSKCWPTTLLIYDTYLEPINYLSKLNIGIYTIYYIFMMSIITPIYDLCTYNANKNHSNHVIIHCMFTFILNVSQLYNTLTFCSSVVSADDYKL